MNHHTLPRFWHHYHQLSQTVQLLADKCFKLLKANPQHPSLQLKRIGGKKYLWSVRIGGHH